MSAKLKAGMRVKVYQKPISDEDFEGNATLKGHADKFTDSIGHERWFVRFDGDKDGGTYPRLVHIRNEVK